MLQTTTMKSPIGPITIEVEDDAIVAIRRRGSRASGPPSSILDEAVRQLREYFEGERRTFSLPIRPRGTEFEQRVWQALAMLPYGTTASYGEIARRIGSPRGFRAVGAANRKNPIPIVVPCHRVIGTDGRLTGFALGLETKRWLLAHEGIALAPSDERGGSVVQREQ